MATVHALGAGHDVGVFALSGHGTHPPPDDHVVVWQSSREFAADGGLRLRPSALQWLQTPTGHPSDQWYSDRVMRELGDLIDSFAARLVVVEALWLHRYIEPLRKLGCTVILDAHGIEGPLHEELAERHPTTLSRKFAERTSWVEARAFEAAAQVWVPSDRDAALARARYGSHLKLEVVPNAVELDRYGTAYEPKERFTVAYSASFAYPPNVAAARRLLFRIFPALWRRVGRAQLALIGTEPTGEMRTAADRDERITVTGPVDDVAAHLSRASAMAVPLSDGHGTRFKVLEAFASQLPVVSTAKGIEGIDVEAGEHYLAAERDCDFVAALEQLACDPKLRSRLAQHGLQAVRERYSLPVVRERINAALATAAQSTREGG
jgi:glycosyltransferase involved in cell wall biosynthesis